MIDCEIFLCLVRVWRRFNGIHEIVMSSREIIGEIEFILKCALNYKISPHDGSFSIFTHYLSLLLVGEKIKFILYTRVLPLFSFKLNFFLR